MKKHDSCNCPCHDDPGIKHMFACCASCPLCLTNIKMLSYDHHVDQCATATRRKLEGLWTDEQKEAVKKELMASKASRKKLSEILGGQKSHISMIIAHVTDGKEDFEKLMALMQADDN